MMIQQKVSFHKKLALLVGATFLLSPAQAFDDAEVTYVSRYKQLPAYILEENYSRAKEISQGVVEMYRQDALIKPIRYSLNVDSIVPNLNASYSRQDGERTMNFPNVLYVQNTPNGQYRRLYHTAQDQGIVAHESGHMVLDYFRPNWLGSSSHIGAFHEAFGDLTSQFYKFYNSYTRQHFVNSLKNGDGCVGDNEFTCIRDNYVNLSLEEVQNNPGLCEVHEFSKAFSSAVYNNMVAYTNTNQFDVADIVSGHRQMLLKSALINSTSPTLMDIAVEMLEVSVNYPQFRQGLGENFLNNGLITIIYRLPGPYYYYDVNQQFQQLCLGF